MTQGRGDGASWVTAFMLSFSVDAYEWQYVQDLYGNQRVCTDYRRLATSQSDCTVSKASCIEAIKQSDNAFHRLTECQEMSS